MKLDTTRPIRLAPCDVAAIVGKVRAQKEHAESMAELIGEYEEQTPRMKSAITGYRLQAKACDEVLRVLSHAQTPDYSANLETPDGKDYWGLPYRPSKGRLDRPGEE